MTLALSDRESLLSCPRGPPRPLVSSRDRDHHDSKRTGVGAFNLLRLDFELAFLGNV